MRDCAKWRDNLTSGLIDWVNIIISLARECAFITECASRPYSVLARSHKFTPHDSPTILSFSFLRISIWIFMWCSMNLAIYSMILLSRMALRIPVFTLGQSVYGRTRAGDTDIFRAVITAVERDRYKVHYLVCSPNHCYAFVYDLPPINTVKDFTAKDDQWIYHCDINYQLYSAQWLASKRFDLVSSKLFHLREADSA